MDDRENNMVEVRGAYKRYSPNAVILKGLNMSVEKGTIYAFLGPSGCGKTTLLKCILGRQHLDTGEISIDLKKKSEIGYMPQEISLLGELTIRETFAYYGRMYAMPERYLQKRIDELISLLELPPENRVIRDLSGGQQRRVSLSVALLHNPRLLILDEPTVGVDPVLSHSIWEHLKDLSAIEMKTIIITTHYIEEARHSDNVGMMREGVLLVEDKPNSIMERYGFETLEEVFVQLSYMQASLKTEEKQVAEYYPTPADKPKLPIAQEKLCSYDHVASNVLKNLYFLKRSSLSWFLLFLNPLFQCILFEYAFNEPKNLKFGIVNDELSYNQTNCDTFFNESCFPSSCRYLTALQKHSLDLVTYKNIYEAHNDAKMNRIWGFLHIHANFTDSLNERLMKGIKINEETMRESEIAIVMDKSNRHIASLLEKALSESFFEYLDLVGIDCAWMVQHIKLPIQFNKPIFGEKYPKFSDFAVNGIIILIEFFLPVAYSLSTLKDKFEGVEERNLISGMTSLEILLGHAALTLVIYLVQTLGVMFILYGLHDHKIHGSYILILAMILLIGFGGMCFGYVIAEICDRDADAIQFSLGSYVILSNICGMFWPIEGMHYILRSAEWALPLAPVSQAYRGIAERAWTITHPIVSYGFFSMIVYIIIFCGILFLTMMIKNRK